MLIEKKIIERDAIRPLFQLDVLIELASQRAVQALENELGAIHYIVAEKVEVHIELQAGPVMLVYDLFQPGLFTCIQRIAEETEPVIVCRRAEAVDRFPLQPLPRIVFSPDSMVYEYGIVLYQHKAAVGIGGIMPVHFPRRLANLVNTVPENKITAPGQLAGAVNLPNGCGIIPGSRRLMAGRQEK